jgi:hypothetical protein
MNATWFLGTLATAALLSAAPALAQQATPADRAPSRLQAAVAAQMIAPSPDGVPAPPTGSGAGRGNSQTFGDGSAPTFRVLNFPVGVDSGVAAPYAASWADTFGGQPASSGGELLARASGIGSPQ